MNHRRICNPAVVNSIPFLSFLVKLGSLCSPNAAAVPFLAFCELQAVLPSGLISTSQLRPESKPSIFTEGTSKFNQTSRSSCVWQQRKDRDTSWQSGSGTGETAQHQSTELIVCDVHTSLFAWLVVFLSVLACLGLMSGALSEGGMAQNLTAPACSLFLQLQPSRRDKLSPSTPSPRIKSEWGFLIKMPQCVHFSSKWIWLCNKKLWLWEPSL